MHLVFDIDGTVVDHTGRTYGLYKSYSEQHGLPVLTRSEYFERKGRGDDERAIAVETFPRELVEPYLAWKLSEIETPDALEADVLVAGMGGVLEALARSQPLVVLSARRSNDLLIDELARLGVWQFFETSLPVGASGGADAKAMAIRSYLAEAGLPPQKAVLIGDTEVELSAARQVGLRCVSVSWGLRSPSYLLLHGASRIVESVGELHDVLTAT